ncbi:AAA family ATPase [Flavobacterium sp. GA093]|uniref:AAA family ATPase n=1 Tax=Flavobacterium hydrocarbonoxydans TaxID=2683249 RepID=A0A6I4NJQ2_9FLAO|nr:AAA family ATPase [Flavobacterium hydrocarbonoxydans]MWB94401.1 AAA family ATPase [Flavobacterium hydrocarbonoxydans]
MKISKLHIDQFRHLENLDFDFTYPEDFHIEEKRGKPLDKICFIGQSATGKTGLLELFYERHFFINNLFINNQNYVDPPLGEEKKFNGSINFNWFDNNDNNIELSNENLKYNNDIYYNKFIGGWSGQLFEKREEKKLIYYFKANLISDKNIDIFTKNPIDLIEKHQKNSEISLENILNSSFNTPNILFNDDVDVKIWLFLLSEILEYRKNFTQKMSELIHKGLLSNPTKLDSEYKKWQKENPNELEAFVENFNPILEKLNLEVDLVNTEYSIPIKNKRNDEIIPIQNTSTGTKGLLLSFLPLFKLETKDSIILIDEPERSLYPDMQMDLMDHYQNLAPKAQFIVATHSPFVAASFEPEERFILYFDEEGKVAVRRGSSPIGDDPNDMLKNDFGVNYYNKHGEEAYQRYITLKQEVANESDPKRKKELLLETVKLGDTYNF